MGKKPIIFSFQILSVTILIVDLKSYRLSLKCSALFILGNDIFALERTKMMQK